MDNNNDNNDDDDVSDDDNNYKYSRLPITRTFKGNRKRFATSASNSKLYAYNMSMGNSKFNVWDASGLFFPDF